MNTVLVTEPLELPVSLAEAKNLLKLDEDLTEDDALVVSFIRAAVEHAQDYQSRKFITQTWELVLPAFPASGVIQLPFGKLQAVISVSYRNTSGNLQTLPDTAYQVDTSGILGKLALDTIPSTASVSDAVRIQFICGYGDNPGDVPEVTRTAILFIIKQWYDKRGERVSLLAAERMLYTGRIVTF